MCMNCVSHTEVVVGQIGLAAAVLKDPVHRMLASAGIVAPYDPRCFGYLPGYDW